LKRYLLCLALGAGLLCGCSASQTTQTAAGLSGTYDLTAVGGYVFVTSADRNELRALDLNASPRDWVRAPNPLEPLSIPVLERPIYLARDVRYDADGAEVTGPYVYARSTGTEELSVVAADPAYFKEVKRLTGLGFVTAFAARGAAEGGKSVLYYATQDETSSQLFRLELDGPEALLATGSTPLKGTKIPLATPLIDETVTSLLVVPAPEGKEYLVVATRKTSATAVGGNRTFRLDANTGVELVQYKFGGPVRLLATHPKVASTELEAGTCDLDTPKDLKPALPAGTYIFGALDESACTLQNQEACAGILAVDAETGALAIDSTGYTMLPIRVGAALPTGLTLAADARVLIRCGGASTIQTRPLIGIVPASDGRISIFDAAKLRSFDLNSADADSTGWAIIDINGTAKTTSRPALKEYVDVVNPKQGATRDDTYRVIYQGTLPGLASRTFSDSTVVCSPGCSFDVDASAVEKGSGGELPMVRTGDTISLVTADGTCPTEITVDSTSVVGRVGKLTTQPIPTDCSKPVRFTIRAGSQDPLMVFSDAKGYLGRLPVEDSLLPIPGGYYFHPEGFDNSEDHRKVDVTLKLSNLADLDLHRGDQLIVTAQSGIQPLTASVDTATTTAGLTAFRLPGPVVHTRVGDVDFAYIAYPSADGILQVSLGGLVDNTANIRGLVPFE
jgi:hypothetical protein